MRFDISFSGVGGGAVWVELISSTQPEVVGTYIVDTFILRHSLENMKIGRLKNPVVYDTLESWWDDSTKFDDPIYIRAKLDGSDYDYWLFGIKWGDGINKTTKTYTVSSIPYDLWYRYFEANLDEEVLTNQDTGAPSEHPTVDAYDYGTANYPYDTHYDGARRVFSNAVEIINDATGFAEADVKSTILNGDDYPDGSPVATQYGEPLNYATGEASYMIKSVIYWSRYNNNRTTVSKVLEVLRLFQIYPYFDENDDFRLEHIKFFIDEMDSNSAVVSAPQNKLYSYINPELVIRENLKMYVVDGEADTNFIGSAVTYSNVTNRPDTETIDYEHQDIYSNYDYWQPNEVDSEFDGKIIIIPAWLNHTPYWANIDASTFLSDRNHIAFSAAGAGTVNVGSRDFRGSTTSIRGDAYVEAVSAFTTVKIGIYDRSSTLLISNEQTLSTGSNPLTLTLSGTSNDCFAKISMQSLGTGSYAGYTNIYNGTGETVVRVADADGGLVSNRENGMPFSVANILDDHWYDWRPARKGVMNGGSDTFNSTKFNLQRDIRTYYRDKVPTLGSYYDGVLTGYLGSYTQNTTTGFTAFNLNYQEIP